MLFKLFQQREQRILFLDNRVLKINIYIYRSKFKFTRLLHENRLLGWIIRKKKKKNHSNHRFIILSKSFIFLLVRVTHAKNAQTPIKRSKS